MKTETRSYAPGDVIFREGEDSDAAFVLESGRVELIKTGSGGSVRLALLGPGELFGEMGVLDKGPRSATARAESDCVLKIIPRAEFLRRVQQDPDTALKIMTRMARRLRDTDERLASHGRQGAAQYSGGGTALVPLGDAAPPVAAVPRPGRALASRPATILRRILNAVRPGRSGDQRRPRTVAVTPLSLEPEYDQRPYLIEALTGLDRVTVRPSAKDLPPPPEGMAVRDPVKAAAQARTLLADEKVDLLIWGGEDATGRVIELRFAPAILPPPGRSGVMPPEQVLTIPADFDDSWTPLLRAAVLTALGDGHPDLPLLAEPAAEIGLHPPGGMSPGEQATVHAVTGYVCAAAADIAGRADLADLAVQAWRAAVAALPRDAGSDAEWARLHQDLGGMLLSRGEKGASEALLRESAAAFEEALQALPRDRDPRGWGKVQARLGTALFRVDMISGDETALRGALNAFREALGTVSRADDPWRWADLMHAIAQAMQVWGDHARNPEVLKKAVELCRQALDVRTAAYAPALYAATRNNMGSALFLLAKHTNDPEYMRLAAVAFRDALAVHRASGSGGPLYKTIERNLSRAEDLLRRTEGRAVAQPSWASEAAPDAAPLPQDGRDDPIRL